MLYRTPRPSLAALLRTAMARLGGVVAAFRKTGADTAYLDGLNANDLRDLGIDRVDERGDIFYR